VIAGLDHVALPAADPEAMLRFYRALGFEGPEPEAWRASGVPFASVCCGDQKINLHAPALWQNPRFHLRGASARPGCGDLCFVWSGGQDALLARLREAGARVEEGPVQREGGRDRGRARGTSLYARDPDGNLLEFIMYPSESAK
jgi:catechol 2,3-dioxygenase-like lactoylglutathione lyase family enzyme